jgi:hypothetical protein
MGPRFIKALQASLNQGQIEALDHLLRQQQDAGIRSVDADADFDLLLERMQRGDSYRSPYIAEPPVIPFGQTLAISSQLLNRNFRLIFMALHGLYRQFLRADKSIRGHKQAVDSRINTLAAAVNKLTEDLASFSAWKNPDNLAYSEVITGDFWNTRNSAVRQPLAQVDGRARYLHLPVVAQIPIHQDQGPKKTIVTTANLTNGQAGVQSKDYKPENAIDDSEDTFWLDLTLAENEATTNLTFEDNDGATISRAYPGAVVQYTAEFGTSRSLSRIQMLPFSQYPIQLVGLEFFSGESNEWSLVPGFSVPANTDAATETTDWIEHRFVPTQTTAIRLTFLQRNFARVSYLIPEDQVLGAELWDQLLDEELTLAVDDKDFSDLQRLEVQTNPRFRSLISATDKLFRSAGTTFITQDSEDRVSNIRRYAELVIDTIAQLDSGAGDPVRQALSGETEVVRPDRRRLINTNKIEYQIGLADISIFQELYGPVGHWSSPKYRSRSRVYVVELEATEEVPTHQGQPDGSIEYEVEVAQDRRVPLVPKGTTRISQEVLRFEAGQVRAVLRFTADGSTVEIYENGKQIANSGFTITTTTIQFTDPLAYNPAARYTINYNLASGQDTFSIHTDSGGSFSSKEEIELLPGTGPNGLALLKYQPYIAREIVNNRTDWARASVDEAIYHYRTGAGAVTIDGVAYSAAGEDTYEPIKVFVGGTKATNITKYSPDRSDPTRIDGRIQQPAFLRSENTNLYQYIQVGRRLYFSRPIQNSTVEVVYRWITQYLQLHARLNSRRLYPKRSPILSQYRLKLQTSSLL